VKVCVVITKGRSFLGGKGCEAIKLMGEAIARELLLLLPAKYKD